MPCPRAGQRLSASGGRDFRPVGAAKGITMRLLVTEATWDGLALARDLEARGFRLTRAADAEELMHHARHGSQDAAVIDADLPDANAARLLRALRRSVPALPLVAIARGYGPQARALLCEAGADLALARPPEAEELAARIRAIVLRAAGFAPPALALGPLTLDVAARRARVGAAALRLSPLEYELLEALALAGGRTVPRAEAMDRLYACEAEPEPAILDVYLARIRRALATAGAPAGMIQTLRGRGLRLAVAPISRQPACTRPACPRPAASGGRGKAAAEGRQEAAA